MKNSNIKEQAIKQLQTEEGQHLHHDYLQSGTPELAKANDLQYQAFKRSYLGQPGNFILIILANGWYFPTPKVDLYFEQVRGKFEYKLMQNNSNAGFYLATYHTADYCSGMSPVGLPDTIIVEDANGKHNVKVQTI